MGHHSPPAEPGTLLTWARVEDGFYVASHEGGLVGFIDRVEDESFQVCNSLSQQLGFFQTLESAMRCLTNLSAAVVAGTAPDDFLGTENL